MFPPLEEDCDLCTPIHERSFKAQPYTTLAISLAPYLITFLLVTLVVLHKLFPVLSAGQPPHQDDHHLPSDAPLSLRTSHIKHGNKRTRRDIAAISFSTTVALATVLMELILSEISNTLNPAARTMALNITLPALLVQLIIIIPFLEIQSIVKSISGSLGRSDEGRVLRTPWILQILAFSSWLTIFWWVGKALPGAEAHNRLLSKQSSASLGNACLERIGVVGICLMALLSGSASISAPWQSFGVKARPVTDTDIARKQAGLDACHDMLSLKRSRLRALEQKLSSAPQESYMKKALNTVRGNADANELKTLRLEVSGLETMSTSLSSSVRMLQSKRSAAMSAQTKLGKAMILPTYLFSIYCLYRILMMSVTAIRRYTSSTYGKQDFVTLDPVSRFLSLLATHIDPTLDTAAWSRQISFFLTGLILLLSFNSVVQTFYLFARWTPGLLHQAQANLALIIAQICATYVIASALLLRSNLPREVGSVISEALGTPLDVRFVDRFFEFWFLTGVIGTGIGIFVGRKLGKGEGSEDWDDGVDVEVGHKRS